jgi:hypothetical protein
MYITISNAGSSSGGNTLASSVEKINHSLLTSTSKKKTEIEIIGEHEAQSIRFDDDLS